MTGSLGSTSGATVHSGATLGGTGQVNGPVTVNTGGTLEAGMGGNGQLTVSSAVFQSGSNISFGTLSNYAGGTGINVNGTLDDSSGPVTINVTNLIGASAGTVYRLINYSSLTNFNNLVLGTLPSRSAGTLSDTINSNEVDLTITGTDYLIWTGASTTAWNTTDQNWKLASNGSPTKYIDLPSPDAVVFDDSTAATTVTLSTIVHPNSITFNNSSNNYVFQGTGGIAGPTGITMNNGGNVTLATSNAFTGPVIVHSGALNLQNSSALGASSGVTLSDGAAISLQGGITTGAVPLSLGGTGGGGLDGAIVNLGGTNTYAGPITLTDDTTFSSDAGSLTLSSTATIVSNSHVLTLTGSGNGTIAGAMDANLNQILKSGTGAWTISAGGAFAGFTEIDSGTLSVFGRTAEGTGYLVNSGGTLNIGYSNSGGYASQIAFNGNGIGNPGGLNFAPGVTWNSNGGINLYSGATIVSTIGNTGTATIQPFDINTGNYINATSSASGTIFTSNINFITRNYGYALTVDTGSNTAKGDLTIAGVISGTGTFYEGSGVLSGFDKNGLGSLALTGASTYAGGTDIANGSIILSGGNNRLPVATTVQLGGGTTSYGANGTSATSTDSGQLVLNGIQQQVAGILTFGAGTANAIQGGSATLSTLNVAFSSYLVNGTAVTSDQFSGNIGGSATNQNNLALVKTGTATLTLSGSDTYTGGTNVSAGALVFASPGAFPAFTPLTLGAGASAAAAPFTTAPKNTLFTSGLSIAGVAGAWTGKLDLANNDLVVRGGSLSTINSQAKQGYGAGTWQGSGGITSSSAAADTTHLTALGVISNSGISGAAIYSSFDGQTVNNTDILVKYTYYGDANLDGKVDGSDYSRIDSSYLTEKNTGVAVTGWYNGDFNYDGVINGSDYTLIDNAFNTQGAVISSQIASPDAVATAQIAGETSAVPEPATLGLLGIGAIGILGRRRRRQR